MHTLAGLEFRGTHDSPAAAAADLAIHGFFFAMRSCENAAAPQPGLTKTVDVLGVVFLDKDHRETPQDHPGMSLAACVTLLFADQKKHDKNARGRTQKRTNDPVLCPVRRAASLIERIRCLVVSFLGSTTINTHTHPSSWQVDSFRASSDTPVPPLEASRFLDSTKWTLARNPSARCRCGLVPS
jgi:hypothetical protein